MSTCTTAKNISKKRINLTPLNHGNCGTASFEISNVKSQEVKKKLEDEEMLFGPDPLSQHTTNGNIPCNFHKTKDFGALGTIVEPARK